ncbi:MFS transporter [Nocardioides sp.]|uniref:MFS transporter n=1 Tax=Nocardioides sp. TaxID=35761 RepID=UPI003512D724
MTDLTDTATDAGGPDRAAAQSGKTPNLTWALIVISIAQLMVVLDGTITNIALPYIGRDLDIDQANLTWIVTGYALAFGGLLLLGGRLGDLLGRRRVFMTGLLVFAVASAIGGVAQSEAMLLSSRALQGLGAALAGPAALALITTTFPAGPARNRAFAVYAAMSGAGAAVGLILGGWLTGLDGLAGLDVEGWRLTFLINVPIGLVAAALAPRFLVESERTEGGLDVPGAITGTLGLLALVYGITRAGEEAHGWGDTWTIASLAAGVALLTTFVLVESRVAHPLLPTRIFRDRTRAASFAAMMFAPAAMFANFYFLSLFIQQIMGFSSLKAGFAFLPFSFGIVIGAGLASNLVNRIAPRVISGTGTLFAAIGLFAFSRLDVDDSPSAVVAALRSGQAVGADVNYFTHIFPFIVLMAIGMGMVFVPLTLTAVHGVAAQDSGIGSGVLNTMQQVGGALGLAVLGTVSLHFANNRGDEVAGELARATGGDQALFGQSLFQSTYTTGATHALLVASGLMLVASAIIWTQLRVRPEELASDGAEGAPAHLG